MLLLDTRFNGRDILKLSSVRCTKNYMILLTSTSAKALEDNYCGSTTEFSLDLPSVSSNIPPSHASQESS
jgi:hypothetical protein